MKNALVLTLPFAEPFRPPITGALIGEVASVAGCNTKVIDLNIEFYRRYGVENFEKTDFELRGYEKITHETLTRIQNFFDQFLPENLIASRQFILISVFSRYDHAFAKLLLEYLRPKSSAKIVLGGKGVKLTGFEAFEFGKKMINIDLADYWIEGEGEVALQELIKGNDSYPGINGIPPKQIIDINNIPQPNYSFLDLQKYQYLQPDTKEIFIQGSRGCIRHCTFCNVHSISPMFRFKHGENLADEMIKAYEHHGIHHFYFTDSLFNGSVTSFTKMLEKLIAYPNKPIWSWSGYAIVRNRKQFPEEFYSMCKEAGKSHWAIGIESGSERVRLAMKKQVRDEDIEYHFEQSIKNNILNTVLLISTWPDETYQEHLEYLEKFKIWQKYVAAGVIWAAHVETLLTINNDTPMTFEDRYDWNYSKTAYDIGGRNIITNLWYNLNNPDLTHKERFMRSIRVHKEAIKYGWPIALGIEHLQDLNKLVDQIISQPQLNQLSDLESFRESKFLT